MNILLRSKINITYSLNFIFNRKPGWCKWLSLFLLIKVIFSFPQALYGLDSWKDTLTTLTQLEKIYPVYFFITEGDLIEIQSELKHQGLSASINELHFLINTPWHSIINCLFHFKGDTTLKIRKIYAAHLTTILVRLDQIKNKTMAPFYHLTSPAKYAPKPLSATFEELMLDLLYVGHPSAFTTNEKHHREIRGKYVLEFENFYNSLELFAYAYQTTDSGSILLYEILRLGIKKTLLKNGFFVMYIASSLPAHSQDQLDLMLETSRVIVAAFEIKEQFQKLYISSNLTPLTKNINWDISIKFLLKNLEHTHDTIEFTYQLTKLEYVKYMYKNFSHYLSSKCRCCRTKIR